MYFLAALAPASLAAVWLDLPPALVFALAAGSTIAFAALIGQATEAVSVYLGPRGGGFLNATLGNVTELIVSIAAIRGGFIELAKASIAGSIIGNLLLVLGASLALGGWRHGTQKFDSRAAGRYSTMMILSIGSLAMPAIFSSSTPRPQASLLPISLLTSLVLLATYGAYLLFGWRNRGQSPSEEEEEVAGRLSRRHPWSLRRGVLVLGAAIVAVAVVSEVLVGSLDPLIRELGWSEFFVGIVVIPLLGNVAENFTAVKMALSDELEATLAIASGSSIQVALFVAPVLVLLSVPLGHPLTLIFQPLELVALALATGIAGFISLDGESNWLEGVQLIAAYAMVCVVFFFSR